jgi:hypothetical protein
VEAGKGVEAVNDCQCGHAFDEHEGSFFQKCTIPGCYCLDYEAKAFEPPAPSKHPTKPCGDCPFRREAPAGWIGAHGHPSEITDIAMADEKFPCHTAVNKLEIEGADFETAVKAAPYCVGSLIMMNNTCKISRNSFVAELQRKVGKSTDVFANAQEFVQHHEVGPKPKRRGRR